MSTPDKANSQMKSRTRDANKAIKANLIVYLSKKFKKNMARTRRYARQLRK